MPVVVRGMKVDWDVATEITEEVKKALLPQDPADLRVGRLRRAFHVKPPRPGRRTASVHQREEILHPKGSLVFAAPGESCFWIEAPTEMDGRPGRCAVHGQP